MNPGSRIAHYKITSKLGQGGMGAVYRATDTKLDREVAIKVLPESFARDRERLARFEREAKTLASLSHPNIAGIFGLEQADDSHALVLELVEGEDLSERLKRGPLPVEETLDVCRQIAEALEAAHEKGIIHRDLKPGNVKLTPGGKVKVLDFGLAKASGGDSGPIGPDAATLIAETTTPGAVMGTPAYMSPEQARGQAVDRRTDVWAFGCCLYECLTGAKPFRGDTVTDLMAAVLRSDPDWSRLPEGTPREVGTLLRRCLEKDPRRRLSGLGDIAILLDESTQSNRRPTEPAIAVAHPKQHTIRQRNWAWPVAAVLGAALVVAGFLLWRGAGTPSSGTMIRTLAVLPFAFETQDPKLSGLGKWIPAEIRSKLGPLQNLQVVNSPARIEQLVQQKRSEVEIARELGVDGLVMGELHGQGEAMSAYVWVVDGATGRALGKQREIVSSASKVSELPNQVALAIVDELKLQVSASQQAEIQAADTQNAEAFLAHQKGLDLMSSRRFSEAAVELRRALQLDANYTRAWGHLAGSECAPFLYGGTTNEMAATFKRLSGEAERFRAQRPNDPAAASVRMWIAMLYERDWNKVRTTFWESQRNPKSGSELVQGMAWYYTFVEGHPEHALQAIEQGIALDPENLLCQINRGYHLYSFGRYDDAASAFRKLPPEKIQLEDYSRVLLAVGDLTGAKEVATRVLAGRPNAWTQCYMAAIHAKSGAAEEARRILRELEAQAENGMHIPYAQIALGYGMLGDFESARRWLRQGLLEGHGDWSMLSLRTAPALELFGRLPWYWEIVDGMKFPPLQMDNPYFALEQAMRYGRGTVSTATTGTSTNEPPKTLAVLPFANTSPDKSDDSFSDGITEELITSLQKVKGLRVQGRMSSFYFKGRNETPQRVGEQLKVEHLLNGSVSREGNRLRISADLVTAASGFSLWSTNYDRELSDTFAIRTEVAQQVALALKIQLGMEETRSLAEKPTANPEAHRLYLLGRQHFGKVTEAGWTNAMQYFNQALQLDPSYALAYCGLADCYGWMGGGLMSGKEAWAKEKEAAQQALAIDPNLADAHLSLGMALANSFDWKGGEQRVRRALELNPRLPLAHDTLAWIQQVFGQFDESITNSERAIEQDPLSLLFNGNLGARLATALRYEESIAQLRKTLELDPNYSSAHWEMGWCYLWKGDTARAIAAFQRGKAVDPMPIYDGALAYAYARSGDRLKAEQVVRDLEEQSGQRYITPSVRMLLHLGLGEKDQALDRLKQCCEEQDPFSWYLKVSPLYAPPAHRAALPGAGEKGLPRAVINQSIAHYKLTAKLGQGGMGAVYRATDTKLDREVAIKVLPESFALDRERLARFEREAKTLASLNHPNIAGIFGLEETGDSHALVLELVEGEDLSERLKLSPLPVEEALDVCRQIAEALEAAHEKGIIHRDLKPGNVKLTADGKVKVLDFGLAKTAPAEGASVSPDSPTITADYTLPGTLLGTAGYMSPEQARGKPVDKRSDIWSFGVVLWECLTGQRLFPGESVTDSIGALLHKEIDWSQLPPNTPPTIQLLLRKCLARDRKRRLPDIGAARLDLEQAIADPSSSVIRLNGEALQETRIRTGRSRATLRLMAAGIALAAMALTWFLKPGPPREVPPIRRISMDLGAKGGLMLGLGTAARLSPDGSTLAYIGRLDEAGGEAMLFLRRLDQLDPLPLPATAGINQFCYSRDGQWIAFRRDQGRTLEKVATSGGGSFPLCTIGTSRGMSWTEDGWIVFASGQGSGLSRVRDTGGNLEPVTSLTGREATHRWPQILPGGGAVLFTAHTKDSDWDGASVMVQRVPAGEPKLVVEGGYHARYLATGHLVYLHKGTLFAVPYDLKTLTTRGKPVPVVKDVAANGRAGGAHFDVSPTGTLVYVKGGTEKESGFELEWVDRSGNREPIPELPPGDYGEFALSPDGRFLAYQLGDGTQSDIWIHDFQRRFSSRLTSDPANESKPVWSPGGGSIVFHSDRADLPGLYWRRADGSGRDQPLFGERQQNDKKPWSWSPDGRHLAVLEYDGAVDNPDLKIVTLEGDDRQGWKATEITDFLSTEALQATASFSPDGKWLAYASNETGPLQVHVRPFPQQAIGRVQVSTQGSGSAWPTWSADGRQLIFASQMSSGGQDRQIHIADCRIEGGTLKMGQTVGWTNALIRQRRNTRSYDLDRRGQRLLVTKLAGEEAPVIDHVVLVENFFEQLKRDLKQPESAAVP